jgi:hypothetical protein
VAQLKERPEEGGARHAPLKVVRKRLLVEEDPWLTVFAIELILNLTNRVHDTIDLQVACEHEECGMGEVAARWG